MRRVRVLVVDDHDVVRSGMRWLLRRAPWVEACVCASNTEEAVTLLESLALDVALVDAQLGDGCGLQTCLELRAKAPKLRLAVLTSRWDLVPRRTALEVGALGVVSKEARARDLLAAVRRLAQGLEVDVPCPHPEPTRFLPWDREILRLLAAGLTNAEIGVRVHLASGTVKHHASELYVRLGAANRADAVHNARRLGLIPVAAGDDDQPEATDADGSPSAVDVLVAAGADATRAGVMVALQPEPWVAACRGSGRAADTLRIASSTRPDVTLIGTLYDGDGIDLSRRLTAERPTLRTVLVRENEMPPRDVMRLSGASGAVLQSWGPRRLAAAVRAVCADAAEPPDGDHDVRDRVSPRERDVLDALISGATNAEIARRLGLSPHTVKQHVSSIYRKLGVRNRAAAAASGVLTDRVIPRSGAARSGRSGADLASAPVRGSGERSMHVG